MDNKIQVLLKKYKAMHRELNSILDEKNDIRKSNPERSELLQKLADEKEKELDDFTDEFAKYIFDIYSKEKPKLVDRFDKKTYKWDKAFGTDFAKVPKSLKRSLIGLFEDSGRYKFK